MLCPSPTTATLSENQRSALLKLGRTNKVATWTVLVMWMLLALLPAGGLSLCLGADGHVGLGQLSAEVSACPCELPNQGRDSENAGIRPDKHPPCTDLALELPEFFLDKGASNNNDAADASFAPPLLATVVAFFPDVYAQRPPPAEQLPSLTLRQKSTVVLLI